MNKEAVQTLRDATEKEFAATYVDDSQQALIVCARTIAHAIYSVTETLHEIKTELDSIQSSTSLMVDKLENIDKTL